MIPRNWNISLGAPGILAALAGGPFGGQGCTLYRSLSSVLSSILPLGLMALAMATPQPGSAEPVSVPSGLEVAFHDWIDEGPAQRFRFVAPGIGAPEHSFDQVVEDMAFLCDKFALPQLHIHEMQVTQIVVTLMEKPVEFGVMTPEITQFFESYRVEDDLCIWEVF